MANGSKITREQINRIVRGDVRAARALEDLISLVVDNAPVELQGVYALINDASLEASAAYNAAQVVSDSLERIASALELLASGPLAEPEDDDFLQPTNQIGTMGEQQSNDVSISGGSVLAVITDNSANLIASSIALVDAAGSSVGTLTNAPAAGNPTKWVQINDNGTVRRIPSW